MSGTRWIVVFLLVSLAVNVFVGGIWVGRWIDGGSEPEVVQAAPIDRPRPPGPGPRWLRESVGREGQALLRRVWRQHEDTIEPLRETVRESRVAVADALAAEPFDVEVYAVALERMRSSMLQLHTATHAAMIDLVEQMPEEQRLKMAERARAWEEKRKRRKPPPPRQ